MVKILVCSDRPTISLIENLLEEHGENLDDFLSAGNFGEAYQRLDELRGNRAVVVTSAKLHKPNLGYDWATEVVKRALNNGHGVTVFSGRKREEIERDAPDLLKGTVYVMRSEEIFYDYDKFYDATIRPHLS